MKIIVYIGPTISKQEVLGIIPGAIIRPPAKQSDILSDVENDRPNCIVLIDGCFHHNLSPWHKEILYALSKGVHVYGASSMGALRALELEAFGMVGIGEIFEDMKRELIAPDDWVAVAQSEDGKALSMAHVDIAATLHKLHSLNIISETEMMAAIEESSLAHYSNRTPAIIPERFRKAFIEHHVSAKKLDAIRCLELVKERIESMRQPFKPSFIFSGGNLFQAQYERDRRIRTQCGLEVAQWEIESRDSISNPKFREENWHAANRQAALILCRMIGVLLPPDVDTSGMTRVEIEDAHIRQLHKAIRTSRVMRKNTGVYLDHLESMGRLDQSTEYAAVQSGIFNKLNPDYMSLPVPSDDILDGIVPEESIDSLLEESCQTLLELKIEAEKRKIITGAGG